MPRTRAEYLRRTAARRARASSSPERRHPRLRAAAWPNADPGAALQRAPFDPLASASAAGWATGAAIQHPPQHRGIRAIGVLLALGLLSGPVLGLGIALGAIPTLDPGQRIPEGMAILLLGAIPAVAGILLLRRLFGR